MLKRKIIPLVLAFSLLLSLMPGAFAATEDNVLPNMASFSVISVGENEVCFTQADFLEHVPSGLTLDGIIVGSLPDEAIGTLCFGGRELMIGEALTADSLSQLTFRVETTETAVTQFDFLPVFSTGVGTELVTVDLRLLAQENRPPVAENMEFETYKNMAVTHHFKGHDPDGDELVYKITKKPKRGEVELLDDGSFTYTPFKNKTGNDSFTYVATDKNGNESAAAEVNIKIDKPAKNIDYADMEDDAGNFAATKLAEAGIFIGERVGNQYFFRPEATVNRGEFLAMVLALVGETDIAPVSKTGFADDDLIPAWVKPYASAALKAGIIHGAATSDGRKELRATQDITRAEAAVTLNNALKIVDVSAAAGFSDWEAAPAWSQQAALNVSTVGIIELNADGEMEFDGTITRADAAELMLNALKFQDANKPKTGLFAWIFG